MKRKISDPRQELREKRQKVYRCLNNMSQRCYNPKSSWGQHG